MTAPAITVILPTYRRPELLARALRSVLDQTCTDWQVLVCDNRSDDGTAAVVERFASRDQRIGYQVNERNIGALANFGRGFAQVRTPYFCLFSDDDVLLPRCLEVAKAGLDSHPDAMAWGGLVLAMGADGLEDVRPVPAWPDGFSPAAAACALVVSDIRPENTGLLFRREVLDPDFHPPLDDFHAVDVNWVLHAAAKGGIGITREPLAVFTRHPDSTSTRAGFDPADGLRLSWPSALHLHDRFPRGRLGEAEHRAFRTAILQRYGSGQLRHLGRMAAVQGREPELATCIRLLRDELGDAAGADRVAALGRWHPLLLRLWFGVLHRLGRPPARDGWDRLERIARDGLAFAGREAVLSLPGGAAAADRRRPG